MGRLDDRVAVVTGASAGIGRAVAQCFATEGADVVLADTDRAAGAEFAEGIGAVFADTDVSDRDQVEAMVQTALDRFGRLDILVNNAWGGGSMSRVEHKSDAQIDHGLAVGFKGPLWAMQAAFEPMRSQGGGRIINMCSLNGVNAHIGTLDYNSAKEALRAATRTAAREWAQWQITVNAVCPAAKSASFAAVMGANPELEAMADASNPMGRIGDPDLDVAPPVLFLASDDARYVTGNTLFVDGGSHINGVAWAPDLPVEPPTTSDRSTQR